MAKSSYRAKAASALGSLCLAVTLLAAGLFACCLPATTAALASYEDGGGSSPYNAEQLEALALAARAYTVEFRAGGDEAALERLCAAEAEAAFAASDDPAKADDWTLRAREAVAQARAKDLPDSIALTEQLAAISDRYALDANALSHLDDCNRLINGAAVPLMGATLVAIGCIVALGRREAYRPLGGMLVAGPTIMIALLAALALWAAVDFMGFFGAFHGLLFPQGNWTFPVDSLLITMYPTHFWMGMGAVWAAVTALLSILSVGFGIHFLRKERREHD